MWTKRKGNKTTVRSVTDFSKQKLKPGKNKYINKTMEFLKNLTNYI
jgi:hypothetical protein